MRSLNKTDKVKKKEKIVVVSRRELTGPIFIIVSIFAVFGALFQLYNAGFGVLTEIQMRSFHWMYIGFISFLCYSYVKQRKDDHVPVIDILLAVATLACSIYIYFSWPRIAANFGFTNTLDTVFGIVLYCWF